MPKSAFATFRLIEHLNSHQIRLFVTGYHHLGNAFAIVDDKGSLT